MVDGEALHALQHSPPISGDKAQDVLGHKPRPTQATVAKLYDWLVETGSLET